MRSTIFFILFALLSCGQAQKSSTVPSDQSNVEAAVREFVSAGDEQSPARIDQILNPAFRVTINQFMGGEGVTVLDRTAYLGMITDKKIGGSPRDLKIQSVEVLGHTAFVRASLKSDKLIFETLYVLAQDKLGDWTIVSDSPFVRPKA